MAHDNDPKGVDLQREIERNNKLSMWKGIRADLASLLKKAKRAHEGNPRRCEPEYAADIKQYIERFSTLMKQHLEEARRRGDA